MLRGLLLVAVAASTTHVGGQESIRQENAAAIQQLKPLCAQEEATDRAEAQLLRASASAAVTRALASEAAFWTLLTNPATPEAWFAGARARLERQAEGERVRWNAIATELGRRIE